MNYRILGKSGIKISEIGFGCMSLQRDENYNTRLLHAAIEAGINFFDTADLYEAGLNETMLGIALGEKRKQIVLASKVGNQLRSDGKGWDWNPRKEYILSAVEKSLQRLQTDYIDLYQLHGGTIDDPIDEAIEAFELLKQRGKILHYGISSIRPNVIREWVKHSNITSVMMQYSLLDRRPEETCLTLLEENHIGVLARGTLAKGLLVDKPAQAFLEFSADGVRKIQDKLSACLPRNESKTALALAYVLHHPAISSAVAGIRTMEQLNDIIASSNFVLDEKTYLALSRLLALTYKEHR
jgi:aryl-alcohol dehydrogenase-like predicted oxidoreductase